MVDPCNLFVYGSLMCDDVLKALLGPHQLPEMAEAVLPGHLVHPIVNRVYPGLRQTSRHEDTAFGIMLLGLTARQLAILDYFEDEDYDRVTREIHVHVHLDENESAQSNDAHQNRVVSGYVYLYRPLEKLRMDQQWDYDRFLKGDHLPSYLEMAAECLAEFEADEQRQMATKPVVKPHREDFHDHLDDSSTDALWLKMTISKESLTFIGQSRSSDRAVFFVPRAHMFLDCGGAPLKDFVLRSRVVLISHGHHDHCYGLGSLFSQRHSVNVVCPAQMAPLAQAFIDSAMNLNAGDISVVQAGQVPPPPPFRIFGVKPGDKLYLQTTTGVLSADKPSQTDEASRHPIWSVQALSCQHSVPACAYAVSDCRFRLKKNIRVRKHDYLKHLREDCGETMAEPYEHSLFMFFGDCTVDSLLANEALLAQFPICLVECVLLPIPSSNNHTPPPDPDVAHDRGHTHYDSLRPIVVRHPTTLFVLHHFSARYTNGDIRSFFLRPDILLPNVIPFV